MDNGRKHAVHAPMTWGARRAITGLFLLTIAFASVSIFYTARTTGHVTAEQAAQAAAQKTRVRTQRKLDDTVRKLKQEVRAGCRFNSDLAAAPVTVSPATHRALLLGVKIVSDARVAWHQAGCPGKLPPPSPSFTRWARFYHLPQS